MCDSCSYFVRGAELSSAYLLPGGDTMDRFRFTDVACISNMGQMDSP